MCCVKDPFSHYNTLLWYKYDSTRLSLIVHEHVFTQSDLHIIFCIIRAYPSIVSTVCCTVNKYRRCYVMILYWYIIEFNSTQSNEFNNDVSSGKYYRHINLMWLKSLHDIGSYIKVMVNKFTIKWKIIFLRHSTGESDMIVELFSWSSFY